MSKTIEYFFDYGSPFTYLLDTQLQAIANEHGAQIRYRPMLLGGLFKSTGNRPPLSNDCRGKVAYVSKTLQRFVRRYGSDFRFNAHFPLNTLQLMRMSQAALDTPEFPVFHQAVFRAVWVDNRNLGDPAEVQVVLDAAGVDAAALSARAAEPEIKDALRASTEEAGRRGAFGAPTLFVGDEMFFGNDHVPFLIDALKG